MLTEDYIIRMINLAIQALLRIVGLKKGGDYQEALLLIDLTFEQLLGLRSSMAKNLDDERLYYLLTRNAVLDTQRLEMVAELFLQEADIYAALGRVEESHLDYVRALKYFMEVHFNQVSRDAAVDEKIAEVLQHLDLSGLGPDVLWPLASYYEDQGAFASAEAMLLALVERPEVRAEILPEVVAFYKRMQNQEPAALEAGEMTPERVREGLARWQQQG